MRSRSWMLMALWFLTLARSASGGEFPVVITNGVAKPQILTTNVGNLLATGTTGAYSQAGDVVNQKTDGLKPVTIGFTEPKGGVTFSYTGKGTLDSAKYAGGAGRTQSDMSMSSKTVAKNETVSNASGGYTTANPMKMGKEVIYNSTLMAKGEVSDAAKVGGVAASKALDPYTFQFSHTGTLSLSMVLGDASTTSPGSNLEFYSNSSMGLNHLDLSASLFGVTYNGMPFNGQVFSLDIDSTGPISSSSDLTINFIPSPLLNLSPTTIEEIDAYVAQNLTPQSDGSVGLAPGTEFALIGAGSPLNTLSFGYGSGTVVYEDVLTEGAISLPEPTSIVLAFLGLLGGISYMRLQRSRAKA